MGILKLAFKPISIKVLETSFFAELTGNLIERTASPVVFVYF